MKTKTLLLTIFKTNNIGAVLQAYALYKVLNRHSDVTLLDLKNGHINSGLKLIRFSITIKSVLSAGKDLMRINSRKKIITKFDFFLNKLKKTDETPIINKELSSEYDYFFTGSDQIWNPKCISKNRCLDLRYFFDGINSENINSYGSSKGSYIYDPTEKTKVINQLKKFKNISVREKDFRDYLLSHKINRAKHVLDPSLLLNKSEWSNLIKHNTTDESIFKLLPSKYNLVYTIPRSKNLKHIISRVKKINGLPIITIDQNPFPIRGTDVHLAHAGPLDFLKLFLNAEFIITDSFHGVCFAVNFSKNFLVSDIGHLSNRIKSLLHKLNLENRMVSEESLSKINKELLKIDFQNIKINLDHERTMSLKFISKCYS